MVSRKNKILDGVDREILRALYNHNSLVTRNLAKRVGLTSSAIVPRLNNLARKGIIKQNRTGKIRSFERGLGNKRIKVRSSPKIYWSLDLES